MRLSLVVLKIPFDGIHKETAMTMDEFYFRDFPAVLCPYIDLDQQQLNRLTRNAQDILNILEHTKKSVAALTLFRRRLRENRVVRCTIQSVKFTAAARYVPNSGECNLDDIPVNVFIDLVTYLPLLDVKVLAEDAYARRRLTQLFFDRPLNPRWGTYYTYLTRHNKDWAKCFFDGLFLAG